MEEINFNRMGIYDLRNYARSIGVHSPTKLKRDELIANIKAVLEGVKEPERPKVSRGRPPKHKVDEDFMLDMFVPNNLFCTNPTDARYMPFQQPEISKPYSTNMLFERANVKDNILFDGYFEKINENYGFIYKNGYLTTYSKENVVILKDLIEKYDLQTGDFVEGACKLIETKNIMLATDVSKINDISTQSEMHKITFANLKIEYPTESINLSKYSDDKSAKIIDKVCPIAFGGRVAIDSQHDQLPIDCYISILNALLQRCKKVLFVSIDDVLEDICQIEYRCPNVQFCAYDTDMTRDQFFQKLDLMAENYCRRLECNQDVAIVIYNIQKLQQNIKNSAILKNRIGEVEANIFAQNKIKDYFKMARCTEASSLTIVAFGAKDEQSLQFANCQIIVNYDLQTNQLTIDTQKSFTNNVQKILSPKDFQKLTNFKIAIKQGKDVKEQERILLGE